MPCGVGYLRLQWFGRHFTGKQPDPDRLGAGTVGSNLYSTACNSERTEP